VQKRDPNETAFGSVTKYWPVDLKDIKASGNFNSPIEAWDFAIESSSRAYEKMAHNLFCNNCHDHVARVLNALEFRGRKRWNTFLLIVYMIGYSQFVSFGRWFKTYVGFFGLTILITLFALI
jgi:arylsulfatase A-like enzyme